MSLLQAGSQDGSISSVKLLVLRLPILPAVLSCHGLSNLSPNDACSCFNESRFQLCSYKRSNCCCVHWIHSISWTGKHTQYRLARSHHQGMHHLDSTDISITPSSILGAHLQPSSPSPLCNPTRMTATPSLSKS